MDRNAETTAKPPIFLGVADFIYTDEKRVKILELGSYDTSNFEGINQYYSQTSQPVLFYRVVRVLIDHFKAVHYVAGPIDSFRARKILRGGVDQGNWYEGLEVVERQHPGTFVYYNPAQVQDSQLLWIIPIEGDSIGQCSQEAMNVQDQLKQKGKAVAVLPSFATVEAAAQRKSILYLLAQNANSSLTPRTHSLHIASTYSQKLQEFMDQVKGDKLIIKPTDETLAHGVFILTKEHCMAFIQALQRKDSDQLRRLFSLYCGNEEKINELVYFWTKNRGDNEYLVLQEFCQAAILNDVQQQRPLHHAKGRVVFMVHNNEVSIIDTFFYVPKQTAQVNQFTQENCVTGGYENGKHGITFHIPSTNVREDINEQLRKELPAIFAAAQNFNLQQEIIKCFRASDMTQLQFLLLEGRSVPLGTLSPDFIAVLEQGLATPQKRYFLLFLMTQVQKYIFSNCDIGKYPDNYIALLNILQNNLHLLTRLLTENIVSIANIDEFTESAKMAIDLQEEINPGILPKLRTFFALLEKQNTLSVHFAPPPSVSGSATDPAQASVVVTPTL